MILPTLKQSAAICDDPSQEIAYDCSWWGLVPEEPDRDRRILILSPRCILWVRITRGTYHALNTGTEFIPQQVSSLLRTSFAFFRSGCLETSYLGRLFLYFRRLSVMIRFRRNTDEAQGIVEENWPRAYHRYHDKRGTVSSQFGCSLAIQQSRDRYESALMFAEPELNQNTNDEHPRLREFLRRVQPTLPSKNKRHTSN